MEATGNGNQSDADFRSLFSIPLSSLFNFQRSNQQQQQQAQQPPPPPPTLLPVNGFDANYYLQDSRQQRQQQAFASQHPSLRHHQHHHHHHNYQQNGGGAATGPFAYFTSQSSADSAHYSGNEEEPCSSPLIKHDVSTPINLMEFGFEPSEMEIDSEDLSLPAAMLMSNRPNHSEVEKMRRDRMNSSIGAMARLVPACRSASRKLDKLTVLRLAAQHIKLLRARASSLMQTPADLFSGEELQLLLSNKSSLEGFLLVVGCDRARILGAANCSNNGIPGASINSSDLIGQCLLDLVHPRDADLLRQQLAVPDLPGIQQQQHQRQGFSSNRHDSCGLRRRFFCRFRHPGGSAATGVVGVGVPKRRGDARQYVYLSCSGLLHLSDDPASASAAGPMDESANEDSQSASAAPTEGQQNPPPPLSSSCLLLVCRPARPLVPSALPSSARSGRDCQFSARLGLDACFSWVDQRVTSLLGHLPQDLIGGSLYDFVSRDDINRLSVAHRSALKGTRSRLSCRLTCAWQVPASSEAVCQLSLLCFINPCTGRPEMLSLTCDLQLPQQHQQQHLQQKQETQHQLFSFPNAPSVQDSQSESQSTAGERSVSGPAQLGKNIAADSMAKFDDCAAATDGPVESGWLALGQLVSSSSGSQIESAPSAKPTDSSSLETTQMSLLGADGGLGDEPDYASMLWPL